MRRQDSREQERGTYAIRSKGGKRSKSYRWEPAEEGSEREAKKAPSILREKYVRNILERREEGSQNSKAARGNKWSGAEAIGYDPKKIYVTIRPSPYLI